MYKLFLISMAISLSFIFTNCDRVANPGEAGLSMTGISIYSITIDVGDGLVTREDPVTPLSDVLTIVLTKAPSADVTISGIMSSDGGEVTVSPTTLLFTTANWDVPQTVTVTGVDDAVIDGPQSVTVSLGTATGGEYEGKSGGAVIVTNLDDDNPDGSVVIVNDGLLTREDGSIDTFTVVLSGSVAPTDTVEISLTSSDTGEMTVSPSTLTFGTGDWNIAQTVTVTGADDASADNTQPVTIDLGVTSSLDTDWNNIDAGEVNGFNVDDDAPGIVIINTDGLITTEDATTDSFLVALATEPTAGVTVNISSGTPSEVLASPATLTFPVSSWNVAQPVTLTGQEDTGQVDGVATVEITVDGAGSADPVYASLAPITLIAYNLDNDEPHDVVILDNPAGYYTSEGGGQTTISLVLNQAPTDTVTLQTITSSDTNVATVDPSTLTFTATDWNIPHVITVTGVSDGEHGSGDTNCEVVLGNTTSSDAEFNGISLGNIGIVNRDAVWIGEYGHGLITSGSYTPICPASALPGADGTVLNFTCTDATGNPDVVDEGFAVVSFPFDFHFLGVPYSHIIVYTNGFASFNSVVYTDNNNDNAIFFDDPGVYDQVNILAPWWDDLNVGGTQVAYKISGQKGSRVVTIGWYKANLNLTTNSCSFQIKLYETTNVIEFVYGGSSGTSTSTASVGIMEDTTLAGSRVFCKEGLTGAAIMSAGGSSIYMEEFTNFPTSDTVITFTPPW